MPTIFISAIVIAGAAFVLSVLLIPTLARWAPEWSLLDQPDARKLHGHAVPLVGGIAMTIAGLLALAAAALWWPRLSDFSWWFAFAAILMLIAGVLDDLFELAYRLKALLQAAAVVALVLLAGSKVTTLGALIGAAPIHLGWLAVPFTIVCLLGYVNAMNLIDGLDGLAGGIAVIALGFLAACALIEGAAGLFLFALAFAAATLAFLVYNLRAPWRKRAAVFLGDAGSLVLGLIVGFTAVEIAGHVGHGRVAPIAIAWILALPVMDTVVVMMRRIALRRNPFTPDRLHLHHVLVDSGFTPGQATAALLALAFIYGLYGLMGSLAGLPEWLLFASFLGMLILHALFVGFAHRRVVSVSMPLAHSDSAA